MSRRTGIYVVSVVACLGRSVDTNEKNPTTSAGGSVRGTAYIPRSSTTQAPRKRKGFET